MTEVLVEKNGPVTSVILNRPHAKNAVDRHAADALVAAFLEFERDEDQLAAVFCGSEGAFCAGADLKAVAKGEGNRSVPPATGAGFSRLATDGPMGPSRMILNKPVIGAISGHAVAGGLELALWCDMRVVEDPSGDLFVYTRPVAPRPIDAKIASLA